MLRISSGAPVALRIAFFAVWIPLAVAGALGVFVLLRRREGRPASFALLAAALAFAGLALFPQTIRDTAALTHRYMQLRSAQATRRGGPQDCLITFQTCVRERVWQELRALIPEHATFYVQTHTALVQDWTFSSLLPRTAVANAHEADWVISDRDPSTLGVRFSRTWTIGPLYTKRHTHNRFVVGKVAR